MKTMITLKIEPDQGEGECEDDDQMIMVITAKVINQFILRCGKHK